MSDLKLFADWKGYPLPALNADGQFDSEPLHREWVAFRAGLARRTQPEATAPAQDLSAAIKVARDGLEKISTWSFGWDGDCGVTRVADDTLAAIEAALASSANALSAGDRVDAERFRHIFGTLQYFQARAWLSGFDVFDDTSYIMSKEQAQQMMLNKIDAAILQSQKGGSHG